MTTRNSNIDDLSPVARGDFQKLADMLAEDYDAGTTRTLFLAFEGYRSPERQKELFGQRPRVTQAQPWESGHQYGLCVDFVPFIDGVWSWDDDHDWQHLANRARLCGLLQPLTWDRPHIEHPAWWDVRKALRRKSK